MIFSMAHEVTVILPCAGTGSRLGLPFPKELAPLGPGRVVIDSCLDLIWALPPDFCRVLVMDDGNRGHTVSHIKKRLPGVPVARAEQDARAGNLPDAVLYLEPWFSAVNILMLPDVIYTANTLAVIDLAKHVKASQFAFAAAKMEASRLAELGALKLSDDGTVLSYQDKPSDPGSFHAAWGMIGFSGTRDGVDGLRLVALSTAAAGGGPIAVPPVIKSPVVMIDDFRDCGTWKHYLSEIRRG